MKKFKIWALALLVAVSAGFIGCKKEVETAREEFGVKITLPGKTGRAVFYDASEVATYQINVTQNGYTVVEETAAPGDTVTITLEDLGDYEITVTGKDEDGNAIARGKASVSFAEGDGYKDVVINIEPEEKNIGIIAKAEWEAEKEGYFTEADAVRYDVTIYENDEVFAEYEDVNVLNENYQIDIPWYSTYKIKVEAKKANLDVVGFGEAEFTLAKGDGYKDVVIDIEPEEKNIGIIAKAEWEVEKEGYFTAADAVRYDVTIYENDEVFAEYEDVNVLNENCQIDIPWYSTYKIKVEAKDANLDAVGSGETEFTLAKGDTFKDVTVTIKAERKAGGEAPAEGFGVNVGINWVEGYRREKVQFGEWPQSLADVSELTLTATGKTYDGHLEYSADDGNKYVKVNSENTDWQDKYYKVEPMTWRVIAYNSDGSKKLLADKIYTNLAYYRTGDESRTLGSKTIYPNNYKYSNVRAYLNSINNQYVTEGGTATEYDIDWTDAGFLTSAFNDEEKSRIKETVVDNSAASTGEESNSYACENTVDKIYLLSSAEATKKLYGFYNDEDRIMKTTEYARANGARVGYWWLRSPGYDGSSFAREIRDWGYHRGRDDVYYSNHGVVPALTVTE